MDTQEAIVAAADTDNDTVMTTAEPVKRGRDAMEDDDYDF
jgi:hypothetical protein